MTIEEMIEQVAQEVRKLPEYKPSRKTKIVETSDSSMGDDLAFEGFQQECGGKYE